MKMTKLSIIAASAILGSSLLFTGCGSSSSSSTAGGSVVAQASVVSQFNAGALTLTFNDTNGTCYNNKTLSIPTGTAITFAAADLNASATTACTEALTGEYGYSVNTINSSYDYNTSNVLAQKVGTTFKGIKGKKVNIASTIAIATGQTVEDVDVNAPAFIATKALLQGQILAGTLNLDTMTPADFNITAISTALDAGTLDANSTALAGTLAALGVSAAELTMLSEAFAASTTGELTLGEAATAAAAANPDANLTAITTMATDAASAATAEQLAVSNISLTVGDNVWSAASNEFNIAKTVTQEVNATDDVVLSINAAGLNSFAVSDATLKAVVKTATDTLTVTLDGVSLSTEGTSVSATVAAGSSLSLVSTYSGIASITGTIDSDMTTSDLSFSLNDLIAGISTNTSAITAVKDSIITALATAKSYDVAVGLTGTTTKMTNLESNITCLGTGYEGFQGTVTVGAVATTTPDTNTTTPDTNTTTPSGSVTPSYIAYDAVWYDSIDFDASNPPAVPAVEYKLTNITYTLSGTTLTLSVTPGDSVDNYSVYYASASTETAAYTDDQTSGDIEVTLESGKTYQITPVSGYASGKSTAYYTDAYQVFTVTVP